MTTVAKVIQPILACLKKPDNASNNEDDPKCSSKSSANESKIEKSETTEQPGLIWRMSSQLYGLGSGAVGLGVGSVKWAASTTYNVGTGVVSATQTVVGKVIPSTLPKPKKE